MTLGVFGFQFQNKPAVLEIQSIIVGLLQQLWQRVTSRKCRMLGNVVVSKLRNYSLLEMSSSKLAFKHKITTYEKGTVISKAAV